MQVLVFDFFGVICSEIAPFVLPKYMSAEEAIAYKATFVQDADLGKYDLDEVLQHLSQRTGATPEALRDQFWSYVKIDPAMVVLIEEMRPRYRTALLSNAVHPFLRQILAKHDLERLFDVLLISAEEKLVKPDPAFYRLMVEKLGVPAGECFFIDDNPVNVEAARVVGMRAELFTGVEKLRRDIAAL